MFRYFFCFSVLSCAIVYSDVSSMETSYVRTNWGVVFNKVGVVLNGITKYRHTFAVTIPNMNYRAIQTMACNSSLLREAHCTSVNALVEQINNAYINEFEQMKRNIANVVAIIGNVESDKERPLSRKKRSVSDQESPHLSPSFCRDGKQTAAGGGFLATLGKIGSDIFGTPTYDDIKVVDKHICELADTVDLNRREIVASNERLSSISGALNNRISVLQHGLQNMNERITETQNKLTNVARSVVDDINELNVRINFIEETQEAMYLLLGNLEKFEHNVVRHLRFASNWLCGINRLLEGYIPENLITVGDIQTVLDHVDKEVLPNHPQLNIVHSNPSFYYQVRSTTFTRSENYVFITLTVPLKSVGGMLSVYRVDRTHISTAEHHRSSTRVANLPDFFAVTSDLAYYTELSVAHYTSCRGEGIKVCPTEKALQDANRLTCAGAIFYDKKESVLQHCQMQYEPYDLPSEVIRMRDEQYLVHSENAGPDNTWTLHCPHASPSHGDTEVRHLKQIPSCNTCVIRVPCGCSLDGGSFYIPLQLTGCNMNEMPGFPEVTKVYPVNLPVLTALYSANEIADIAGDTTHEDLSPDNPLALTDVQLNITKSDWEDVVAKDEKYKVDFKRLMKLHKKGSMVYADRAEYYLKKATDFTDLNLAHVKDLEDQFGGNLYREFLNPSSVVGGISLFWIVAIVSLSMSIYNCWKRR